MEIDFDCANERVEQRLDLPEPVAVPHMLL